jgi:intraflagellar transport protein 122
MRYIELVNSIETRLKSAGGDKDLLEHAKGLCQAEICAWNGDYQEAAKAYAKMGEVERAINLFVDLRQWDEAKVFAAGNSSIDSKELTRRQAEWAEETNDWKKASEMYLSAGDPVRACKIIGDNKGKDWQLSLIDIARNIPKSEVEVLRLCAGYFEEAEEEAYCKEVYMKLDDYSNLMQLYVKKQNWAEATKLADEHEGKFDKSVFLPYAEWLAVQDRFDAALEAFRKAGQPEQSQRMMEDLTYNAVVEGRFKDAAYYYFLLGNEVLKNIKTGVADAKKNERWLLKYNEYMNKADWYYAYAPIYQFCNDPFTPLRPEMLFQVSRFLINSMGMVDAPFGISKVNTLYTLAKQAKVLGAFKLARSTYDRLQQLKVPEAWDDNIDLDMMTIQAKPVRDNPELAPVCYRCGSTNALLNPLNNSNTMGDKCTNCSHPFVRSFVNFDILPLVEFFPSENIEDDEALEIMRTHNESAGGKKKKGKGGDRSDDWGEGKRGESDVMTFGGDDDDNDGGGNWNGGGNDGEDLFERSINAALEEQDGSVPYKPVIVTAKTLASMKREEVYVCQPIVPGMRMKFFKNMIPDISVAISQPCHRFFNEEDFEFVYLSDGMCPYSRDKEVGDYGPI